MLTAALVASLVISALCIGTWVTSQGRVDNAREIYLHSVPGVRDRNLDALRKAERERRIIGWVGAGTAAVAAACALLRD
jgi:hypothetical protein